MTPEHDSIKCLILPLSGHAIVVPNTLAAEIITQQAVTPVEASVPWLLGTGDWRGIEIPLIAFDTLCGLRADPPELPGRYLVMHAHRDKAAVTHYGIRIETLPRTETLQRSQVIRSAADDETKMLTHVSAHFELDGRPCLVPDLDALLDSLADVQAGSSDAG